MRSGNDHQWTSAFRERDGKTDDTTPTVRRDGDGNRRPAIYHPASIPYTLIAYVRKETRHFIVRAISPCRQIHAERVNSATDLR